MRWTCLSTKCFYTKPTHLPSSVPIITTDIINTTSFEHLYYQQFYRFLQSLSSSYSNNHKYAELLHSNVIKIGSFHNLGITNHLLDLYAKNSQNLSHAHKLFDEILCRDVRTWTILISGFAQTRNFKMVSGLFRRMQKEGVCPNQFTLSSVLKCCSSICEIRNGKGIHGWILTSGIGFDIVLENSILDLYVKCGAFDYAKSLFDSMAEKGTVSWNIMIGGYLRMGDVESSLELFQSLYFKNIASWNTIIDGLMKNGFETIALELLYKMVESGLGFNSVTFSVALNLVSCLVNLELGKQIHGRILRLIIHDNGFIRNSLLDMYCKCGKMEEASRMFRNVPVEISCDDPLGEIVSWSSMISGYVRNGEYEYALRTFISMVHEQVLVDKFTLTSVVSACANTGCLELGRQIHAHILKIGHKVDAHLGSSLIDMYAKCGSLNDAQMIFKENDDPNVVLWTSMIFGCALHGQGREAVRVFKCMMNEGITPNEITFISVLTACNHAGLLEEGCKYFELMPKLYGIKPGIEHYACMVDLFGRAGRLNEAKGFIEKNGVSHLSAVWKSFLSSCRLHKNVEMGKWASIRLLQLEQRDAGSYILLSNMYATDHRWEEAAKVRSLMQQKAVKKLPGQSWVQLKNQVHTFIMGDRSHPQDADIYFYLEKLLGRLKEIGYSSDVKSVTQDVEEEQSELLLGFHSEKLALTYAIMCTSSGTPIRIMKNLRVCTDCHNFMKYTSQLLGREIIVRDLRRFHHFKQGHCSCGDYW
ncbi:pentatricopeptide repeat-containing protein At4g21065-like [Ricinus communis]|uniref:pentatricopeptide repeat-containing protein At4g21065-like n=1 Tax=Ricinus communis TaxID=3988 RepID=UPI0007724904|nr:pentatricopeptide repeat-containing protein At4g21065-like [Ricinus communis]XP_025012366.1 pentatricopeptide repeat-containing protein At4g21065-like [Ricinus communis]XP_025012368.1 pentatricopeptide repeat-containing protein At4g21065-like [Ricinus communis]XP_048232563.1 pentatricopeptide repeat-containing protein At4g21065-like [Ricinus communis]XP_048232564.1 pentatricopeptide repeat-containing protein At4g21065-like [Ricinus communis]|eukprot:XP_015572133.1 pentatricopeptide repeat-containing protein At4g21065-like [Ricinus communis]